MRLANTVRAALAVAAFFLATTESVAEAQGRRGRGAPPAARGTDIGRGRGNSAGIRMLEYLFAEAHERIPYDLFVSSKVDKTKKAPLIIFLHGLGTPPSVMLRFLRDEAETRGYVIAAPTGYNLWGWYGVNGPTSPGATPPNLGELSEKDVINVLELVREEFSIDERRIYLVGQSMGGAGVLYLGPKYRHIWAALAASAPALRQHQQPAVLEQIKNMPVILIHGDADRAVPVALSRTWAAKMKELNMVYEYREIGGGGHSDGIPVGATWIFNFFDKHRKPEGG